MGKRIYWKLFEWIESKMFSQNLGIYVSQESLNLSTSCMTIETIKPTQVDWIECKRIWQLGPIYFFLFFIVKMFTVAICLFFRKTKLSVLVACNKLQTESTNAAAIYKTKDFPSTIAKLQKYSSSFGIRFDLIQFILEWFHLIAFNTLHKERTHAIWIDTELLKVILEI